MEDADANIYEDLPDFRYDITLDQLNASIAKLEAENSMLQSRLVRVIEEKKVLEANCSVLNTNISSLLKTAKLEIKRKERTIVELREQLNKVMPQKKHFGLKRRRETRVTPSPRKKPRFSPRKSREDRRHLREDSPSLTKKDARSISKLEVLGPPNRDVKVDSDGKPISQTERRDRLASKKENEPVTDPVAPKKPQSKDICSASKETAPDPCLTTASSVLPAFECRTVFSSRMYKRLYGKEHVPAGVGGSVPSNDTIQPDVDSQRQKAQVLLRNDRPSSPNKGPSQQKQPSCCSHVTPDDIRTYLEMDDSLKSHSSLSSSPNQFDRKPVAANYVKPHNRRDVSSDVSPTVLEPKLSISDELPSKKLQEPMFQQAAVEPVAVHSALPCRTEPVSSKVDVEPSTTTSPTAKVGLLAVGKTRQQTVAAVRPIQKLADQEKLDQKSFGTREPNSSIENFPESKVTEAVPTRPGTGKANRLLKIPRLSGPAKARPVRQVFAPISNQWNHSVPNPSDKNECIKKDGSELSSAKTVPVTSELSVRVDDLKQHDLNAQALFGSPVKWADDSDLPVSEGPIKSRKLYSIFGSPCIDRSNSSEHPFALPPGAYEDSCWTNQTSQKVAAKSPGEANLQQQETPELVPEAEPNRMEISPNSNDAEKPSTTNPTCPPPSLSVVKKHVSIFSPLKDSKHSVANKMSDEPSRSNTGICFPFTRYGDSVLGHFDDTAQFVSALAKVDTKLSPLSTPVKSGDGGDDTQHALGDRPTSFRQVFEKKLPEDFRQAQGPGNLGTSSEGVACHSVSEDSSNKERSAGSPHQFPLARQTNGNPEGQKEASTTGARENSLRQTIIEPPTITVTPPKTESSLKLIHRPNFASSTILSVKSWFPNAPIKMVTPRKTPRLVSKATRSVSPKGLDVSAGARVAINDAFIIEQEERVRRWELDHLYENTVRSGDGSPVKSMNGSPTRKRFESKISPSKRSPKKQISPCKSSMRTEACRNPEVDRTQCRSNIDPAPHTATNKESIANQSVAGSTNPRPSCISDAPENVVPNKRSVEPIESLPEPTKKLLTILNGIMNPELAKTKNIEPGSESSSPEAHKPAATPAPRSADLSSVRTGVEDKHSIGHCKKGNSFHIEPHGSVVERVAPHPQVTHLDGKCCHNAVELVSPKNTSMKNVSIANSSDLTVLPQTPTPCTPLPFNDKSSSLPVEGTHLKEGVTESIRIDSADATAVPPGSPKVTSAKAPQSSDCSKASTQIEINENEGIVKAIQSTHSTPPVPSVSSGDQSQSNGMSKRRIAHRPSKYALIGRVKPSVPLNKSISALITSMNPSASPSPCMNTPPAQYSKNSNFKRSSALKPNANNSARNNLMNSIRSTFFQGPPNSTTDRTPRPNIQPKGILKKSTSNLSMDATCITPRSRARAPDVTSTSKTNTRHRAAGETSPVDRVTVSGAEIKCHSFVQWKLIEVDHSTKPVSLLRKHKGTPENDNPEHKEPSSVRSSLRKTILLDSPLKMSTPAKGSRRQGESAESPKPDEKYAETKLGGPSSTSTASSVRTPEKAKAPEVSSDKTVLADSPRNSGMAESRHSRHQRSTSCEPSNRKSRHRKRDESPTPRQRRKSHNGYRKSHEASPDMHSEAKKFSSRRRNEDADSNRANRSSKSSEGKSKSPSKSSETKSQPPSSKSADETPIVQVTALAPRSRSADSCNSSEKASSARLRPTGVTPSSKPPSTPKDGAILSIPSNRKANFGITSEKVISIGKRPALFSPT